MKDDYLWNRSGEPDPEIQQLEEILGELRYQPRPLEIPADVKIGTGRFQFSRYAIAAAIAMIVLGVGSWLALKKDDTQIATSPQSQPVAIKTVTPEPPTRTAVIPPKPEEAPALSGTRRSVRVKPRRPRSTRTPQLSSEEMAEAVAAKDRLITALRLASSKLNYAQKKAQGANPPPVYHQHKIG